MNGRSAWAALLLALVIASAVGVVSYNAGVSHGLAMAPPAATAGAPAVPAVVYAPYYRPWGWGFGLAPLFFLAVWFMMFGLFRGYPGGRYYRHGWCGGCGVPGGFDEWHRRAHEEMNKRS